MWLKLACFILLCPVKQHPYAHICTTTTVVKTYFMSIITFQKNNAAVMFDPFSPSGHVLLVKN